MLIIAMPLTNIHAKFRSNILSNIKNFIVQFVWQLYNMVDRSWKFSSEMLSTAIQAKSRKDISQQKKSMQ